MSKEKHDKREKSIRIQETKIWDNLNTLTVENQEKLSNLDAKVGEQKLNNLQMLQPNTEIKLNGGQLNIALKICKICL